MLYGLIRVYVSGLEHESIISVYEWNTHLTPFNRKKTILIYHT